MLWTVTFVNNEAQAEIDCLSSDLRAKFLRIVALIETKGLERVHEPYIKHLENKLWEMRMIGRDNIARSIYLAAQGRRVVVLHTFIKKSDKTPVAALELARRRAKEVR